MFTQDLSMPATPQIARALYHYMSSLSQTEVDRLALKFMRGGYPNIVAAIYHHHKIHPYDKAIIGYVYQVDRDNRSICLSGNHTTYVTKCLLNCTTDPEDRYRIISGMTPTQLEEIGFAYSVLEEMHADDEFRDKEWHSLQSNIRSY